jgi:hypothetical protein
MTYQELVDFLEHKMAMSHVYQPLLVLVRARVDVEGVATIRRQLAESKQIGEVAPDRPDPNLKCL